MKKHNTLLAGVIFSGIEMFVDDYSMSLDYQTDKEFDTLIINDYAKKEIKRKFNDSNWIDLNKNSTPGDIRLLIYKYAIDNKYDYLVCSDVDDYLENNRMEVVKKYLKNYDFVCNNLSIVSHDNLLLKEDFLTDFFLQKEINTLDFFLDRNFVGLGNSAIKLKEEIKIEIPSDILAFDWFFFTLLVLNNYKGIFTNETTTYYRQYNANLVGVATQINEKSLQVGLNVKSQHYKELTSYCEKYKLPEKNIFLKKLLEINELKSFLQLPGSREKYLDLINANFNKIYCGWWSEILTLNQFKQYE